MRPLLAVALLIQGCEQDCVGVGCLERFSAASADLHLGAELPRSGTHSPTEASSAIQGTTTLGADWDVSIVRDNLIIGSRLDSTVRVYSPVLGEVGAEQDAKGAMVGEYTTDAFGHRVRTIANIDGGLDLLVTAPLLSTTAAIRHVGAVYRFSDLGDGWEGGVDPSTASLRMQGESAGGQFGAALEVCPDMDGDGAQEWVASATRHDTSARLAGQVVLARSTDLDGQPEQLGVSALTTRWDGEHLGGLAGHALNCDQDIDGDGTADLVIGAPFADAAEDVDGVGAVYVVSGASPAEAGTLSEASTLTLQLGEANDWFGWSLATGDLNDDGLTDLVVSAPGANAAAGRVHIWSGTQLRDGDIESPRLTIEGGVVAGRFGWTVHLADINGDGEADLIAGAPYANPTGETGAFNAGQISIFLGGQSFDEWPASPSAGDGALIYTEAAQYLRSGRAIFSGDFDGDEIADLVFIHRVEGT